MSTYSVQVFRNGGQWVIEVPELDIVGQTRTLVSAATTGAQWQAAATWRQDARRLVHDDKLSVRDAAAVLGVSFGRVQQLVKDRTS